MKFKSAVYTQVSGSVGGLTYANNAGGLYARSRSIPVDPSTALQAVVRGRFASLAQAWSTMLTAAQRASWNVWAANNPVTNSFGDPLVLSGQQMYVRCNSILLQDTTLSRVDAAPTVAGLAMLTTPSLAASVGANALNFTYDNADAWATETGGGLVCQASRAQAAGRGFYRGPWRLAGVVQGDTTTPPTSPGAFAPPFGEGPSAGEVYFGRVTAFRADGRPSNVVRLGPVVAA